MKKNESELITENNVEKVIHDAIDTYLKKHMMVDAFFWREASRFLKLKSIQLGRNEIIKREQMLQCLLCGKTLGTEWTETLPKANRSYHMHFCLKCRSALFDRIKKEIH